MLINKLKDKIIPTSLFSGAFMKKVILSLVFLSSVILAGCSSQAGPFVTNISRDGRGGLVVEKCMVRLDRMINTVESSSCTNSSITLSSPSSSSTLTR